MHELALAFVLSFIAAWLLVRPHLAGAALATPALNSGANDAEERLVQMLRDLELDFKTGKLTPDEHAQMYKELSSELAPLISNRQKS